MKHICWDIETDGLLPELSRVHCLVLRDVETGEVVSCADQPGYTPIREGLEILARGDRLYGHNIVGFDYRALRKVYGGSWDVSKEKLRDTLLMARMRFAHIKESDFALQRAGKLPGNLIGSHSLEAWGFRLGILKGQYGKTSSWEVWTPEMQTYCEQDTAVTLALVEHIRTEGVSLESIETEHELAWYLTQQEANGFPFDLEKAVALQARLSARREELGRALREQFGMWVARDGEEKVPKRTVQYKDPKRLIVEGCTYQPVKVVEFNPTSRDHIANRLQTLYGWTPTEFTEKGEVKVDESVLEGLTFPGVENLKEYLLIQKRLGQLAEGKQAWLKLATDKRPEGGQLTGLLHVHGRVNQNGAVTHRATHSDPNMTQVPRVTSPYGEESRSLFHVPPGWVQMGADASGLELRCLAHYLARYDGGEYTKVLLEGDVHSMTRDALGLEGKEGRTTAKTWSYAWLYGAGDEKLGSIIAPEGTPAEKLVAIGKRSRKNFESKLKAAGLLVESVKQTAREKGCLRMPDGRLAFVRSEHAALNTLLQGSGAIICKRFIVEFARRMTREFGPQGWSGEWAALVWAHDEVQLALRPAIAEEACKIAVASIEHMTEHFAWRCPLTGEAKLGSNWSDTH